MDNVGTNEYPGKSGNAQGTAIDHLHHRSVGMISSGTVFPGGQAACVMIDTDPGIDDVAAILMGLGSWELRVEALTTVFGNASVTQSTANALRILDAAGRTDIPVYQGVGRCYNF